MSNLLKDNEYLMREWNYEKNQDLNLDKLTLGSNKKVWWKCSKGHEWQTSITHRTANKTDCPYCSNKKILRGYNDLASTNPKLLKEWNYEKNIISPYEVSRGSKKRVWWICDKGHEWQATINSRNQGRTCPYCSNKILLKGFNDLATINPRIAKEWNYNKNGYLKPEDVVAGSQKSVWWICEKGHEWKTKVDKRNKGNNCPICGSERKTSVSEKSILFYVKKYYDGEIIPNYRDEIIDNKELDIYIKDLKTGIEYDGRYYHKNQKRDILKDKICVSIGIKVYHVIENNENSIQGNTIQYNIASHPKENLEWAIKQVLILLFGEKEYDINIDRDRINIYDMLEYYEKENSLVKKFPDLVKEWHPTKNGKLKPEYFSYGSSRKVWWYGKCGHEWEAKINLRTQGKGCPYCSNNKLLSGFNDLATINPLVAKEWNYKKNKDLCPKDIFSNSNKKVWWICNKGHEWQASVYNRNRGTGCPFCSNKRVLK